MTECKCHEPPVDLWYDEDNDAWLDADENAHDPKTWDDFTD
jgi:hypothetical protein